ncbi:MAG: prepilin-type N-terminal cleavage/methylation domain-containing protein [Candidatus Caenarcaniphilales bacterium]|jgi:prepilin-type N-terminal cleavage/methylation domain-containing protein|nr:prepilin-type N-terminal cleavage/methylation domain-containing protein [Candidatus Caenarcaniphilales bacterium]
MVLRKNRSNINQTRKELGVTLIELLVSLVIISVILVPILGFYNYSLKETNIKHQQTQLRFLASEEIEKIISLPYFDRSIEAYGSFAGKTSFYEKDDYIVKVNVILLDPATGEVPEIYPVSREQDTRLKRITVSVARRDRVGGQVDMIYLKSP